MNLSFVEIRQELKPYIQSLWVFESPIGMPKSANNLCVPNGCPKLVIPYENSIRSISDGKIQECREQGVYFRADRNSATILSTARRETGLIGVEFRPYGAYAIFGIPMVEVGNRPVAVDSLLSGWGRETIELVRNQQNVQQKVACVQQQLIALLRERDFRNSVVEFCVDSLKKTNGSISIRELERQTGYTRRHLEALFGNHVGLSPKVLGRIFRFQRFYTEWAKGHSFDQLKDRLYDYYYDQAHFTKEFKRMTGFTPEDFVLGVPNEFGRRLALRTNKTTPE
jgi:AraC-like DNA-binding protein